MTDKFEGRNVEEYKNIALSIKTQFFSDFEGELSQKKDLVTMVPDDNLLVSLFVEKLKLEYANVDLSLDMAEIEAGVTREKEIEAQLAEMDLGEQKSADPAKDKKAADKKQAKGGATKSPDEVLKDELETIRSCKLKGWILLDFPKNLTQMKLLESQLSGFESKIDVPKSDETIINEAWIKVASAASIDGKTIEGENRATQSGLDGVIILNTPLEECERRSNNRKIDPQTSTIYHMEDNPPTDNKVTERLEDYTDEEGDIGRINKSSGRFEQNVDSIMKWSQNFGLQSEKADYCQVQLDMPIKRDDWNNKDDVFAAVEEKVGKIIAFRNDEFQQLRDRVRKQLA